MEETKVLIFLTLFVFSGLVGGAVTGPVGASDQQIQMLSSSRFKRWEGSWHHTHHSPPPPPPPPPPSDHPSYMAAVSASLIGSSSSGNEPLACWSCSSSSHGNPCYNIDPDNVSSIASIDTKSCSPEEVFCTVVHIWYVVETVGEKENVNFSVNRTCAAECNPYCIVIGDRTKIHSCTSCCTESFCNMDSSSSSKHTHSISLLASALIVAITPVLGISIMSTVMNALGCGTKDIRGTAQDSSKVFRSSSCQTVDWRLPKNSKSCVQLLDTERISKIYENFDTFLFIFIWLINFASSSSKSFDHF